MKKLLSYLVAFALVVSLVVPSVMTVSNAAEGDVETEPLIYESGDNMLTLEGKISADGDWGAIQVKGDASLTIDGDGESHAINRTGYGTNVWSSQNAQVIINGGYYTNEPDTVSKDPTHVDLIYATGASNIKIYGGTFKNVTPKWTLNAKDHKAGESATIEVYGGKYYQFDPANANVGKDEVTVPDGYVSVKEGDWYTVYKEIADSVTLDKAKATLEVGKTLNLQATVTPANSLGNVEFESSDSNIATVSDDGVVTGKTTGTTTITATVGNVSATCEVTVYEIQAETPELPTGKVDEVTAGMAKEDAEKAEKTVAAVVDKVISGESAKGVDKETAKAIEEAIAEGKTITPEIATTVLDSKNVPAKDESMVRNAVQKLANKYDAEFVIGQYLDLSVNVLADNSHIGEITELDSTVKFTVAIPEDIQAKAKQYFIVRTHETEKGVETTVLNPTVNDDGTLSFATDRFSTYALAYTDEAIKVDEPSGDNGWIDVSDIKDSASNNGGTTTDKNDSDKDKDKTATETGDPMSIALLLGVMGASGVGIAGIRRKRK